MTDADEPRLARSIRSVTRVAIGAVVSVGEQAAAIVGDVGDHDVSPRALHTGAEARAEPRWRHLLVGTAFAASDRAVELSRVASQAAVRLSPLTGWVWDAPMIGPARRRVEATIDGLIERGEAEEALGRTQAGQLLNGTLDRTVASPKVDEVVSSVVGRVLDPVLDEALPKVLGNIEQEPGMMLPLVTAIVREALDPILQEALPKVLADIEQQPEMMLPLVEALIGEALEPVLHQALPQVIDVLNEDPDAIRSLVRDQSTGIAAEMAHNVRSRAAEADDHVDRIVRRITRRKPPTGELTEGSTGNKGALLPGGED